MPRFCFQIILIFLISSVHSRLSSQSSLLDPTFGINGKTVVGLAVYAQDPQDMKVLPDGKILVSGIHQVTGVNDAYTSYLLKLNSDGQIDSTFGINGLAPSYQESDHGTSFHKIVVLPNGKILSAITMKNFNGLNVKKVVIVRYESNGMIDSTFGVLGKAESHLGLSVAGVSFLVQDDGKMVVCGDWYLPNNGGYRWMVLRFTPSGLKDSSFGINGKVEIDFGPGSEFIYAATQQSDGKIVVAGGDSGNPGRALVARLNDSGQLDTTFGVEGKVMIPNFGGKMGKAKSVLCLPDGKLIVTGSNPFLADQDKFCLVKLHANGTIDTSFGNDGLIFNTMSNKVDVNGLYALPEGKILATSAISHYAFMRFNPDGTFDTTFGNNGAVGAAQLNLTDTIAGSRATIFQPDGKIVSLHEYYENKQSFGEKYFTVLRLNTNAASATSSPVFETLAATVSPNPVVLSAVLEYNLPENAGIAITLYDLMGRRVQTLLPAVYRSAGYQKESLELDAALPAGVYWLELSTLNGRKTLKLVKK